MSKSEATPDSRVSVHLDAVLCLRAVDNVYSGWTSESVTRCTIGPMPKWSVVLTLAGLAASGAAASRCSLAGLVADASSDADASNEAAPCPYEVDAGCCPTTCSGSCYVEPSSTSCALQASGVSVGCKSMNDCDGGDVCCAEAAVSGTCPHTLMPKDDAGVLSFCVNGCVQGTVKLCATTSDCDGPHTCARAAVLGNPNAIVGFCY